MVEKDFIVKAYNLARQQTLYWLANGNDAEEIASWLNIVFAIEDRMIGVEYDDAEEEEQE